MTDPDQETLLTQDPASPAALAPGQTLDGRTWSRQPTAAHQDLPASLDQALDLPHASVRYEVLALLGRGGMGEVYRVHDHALDRTVALKRLRSTPTAERMRTFRDEARLTARLQLPGILPVHDLGLLPDGRLYFTMREVDGRTFTQACRDLHAHRQAPDLSVRLRRLVDAFRRACEAVAYAHDAGILHRDLKPGNLMIGAFGEVVVLDWGLGQLAEHARAAGSLVGTPRYMSPEQARGEPLTPASDVWSLGATLRELLTGRVPFAELTDGSAILTQASRGLLPPVSPQDCPWVPPALLDLCEDCLRARPSLRPATAAELTAALADWLDGARRRERALAEVSHADACFAQAATHDARARDLRTRATALLDALPPDAPADQRAPAWDLEDEAAQAHRDANQARTRGEQLLQAALTHEPDLPEAHERIADRAHARHQALERDGRFDEAARLEPTLRTHGRGRFAAYLRGTGALTLLTDPPGATARLFRFEARRRRLEPRLVRELGRTPLRALPLDPGSYLVVFEHPDRAPVRYPVRIGRNEHWHGVPPGQREPEPVHLPERVDADVCYVPAGWFTSSSDLPWATVRIPRHRVWCPSFCMQRLPVSVSDYARYLDDLHASGDEQARTRALPRSQGQPVLDLGPEQRHVPVPDTDGDLYDLRWPIFTVTWHQARAYAAWLARTTGQPWRLPVEHEYEKAARGVDERRWPWGNDFEATFLHCVENQALPRGPGPVGVPAQDVSVYGIQGLAGGMACWTLDRWPHGNGAVDGRVDPACHPGDGPRIYRGGTWSVNRRFSGPVARKKVPPTYSGTLVGIRLVRPGP